jgi:carbon monoxide dehydrogenase subunit G
LRFALELPLDVPPARLSALLADRPSVIRCIPGVESVEPAGEGYALASAVRLGPVRLRFSGTATVRDAGAGGWAADVSLHDPLSGSIYGAFALRPTAGGIAVEADVTLGGRLGEFAAALLRRRAEETVRGFAANLARLAAGGEG